MLLKVKLNETYFWNVKYILFQLSYTKMFFSATKLIFKLTITTILQFFININILLYYEYNVLWECWGNYNTKCEWDRNLFDQLSQNGQITVNQPRLSLDYVHYYLHCVQFVTSAFHSSYLLYILTMVYTIN